MTAKKIQIGMVDMTPTWVGLLPAMLELIKSGPPAAVQTATAELTKLARFADQQNRQRPHLLKAIEAVIAWDDAGHSNGMAGAALEDLSTAIEMCRIAKRIK